MDNNPIYLTKMRKVLKRGKNFKLLWSNFNSTKIEILENKKNKSYEHVKQRIKQGQLKFIIQICSLQYTAKWLKKIVQ